MPSGSTSVLIIDPIKNTADTIAISGLTGSDKFRGGVLAPNGKIYGVPYVSSSVLTINTGIPNVPSWMLKPYFNKL